MKFFITCLLSGFMFSIGLAQSYSNFWTDVPEDQITLSAERTIIPQQYRTLSLDFDNFRTTLATAPLEFSTDADTPLRVALPLPDGTMEVFEVLESPVMMPGLAAKYPHIKSFKAYGTRHKTMVARFDYSHKGFHAAIHTDGGTVNIDPYMEDETTHYISYFIKDDVLEEGAPVLGCGYHAYHEGSPIGDLGIEPAADFRSQGALDLRTYRFALSCTGEFAVSVGGDMDDVVSAFNTVVNRLNEIFEREVAVRMLLIDENEQLIHLSGATDPYSEPNNGGGLLGQNQLVVTNVIGTNNFDLGHIMTRTCTDVGGIASLASLCDNMRKAQGVTCHSGNIETTVTRVMAHEVGHQFSATHTMNMCDGNEENITGASSYEPGSGTTIMSYAGVCGSQNVTADNDDYFHANSIEQMVNFTRTNEGSTCATIVPIGNNEPEITLEYEDGFFIPTSTPFVLTGSATDPDGDAVFYNWDGFNVGPNVSLGQQSLASAIFRSYPPSTNPTRIFPKMSTIVNNDSDPAELLPTYDRNLSFRFMARDHHETAGATVWEEVSFEVHGNAGPFLVNHPNDETVEWEVGEYTEVTWDVASTNNPNKVNCQRVNIKLSTDGGFTYPITLIENTPNDGSEFITVPNNETVVARVKVEAADNIFFDISNRNFHIVPATAPGVALTVTPGIQEVCLPNTADITINTESLLGYDSLVTFAVIDGLPDGAIATFSDNDITPNTDLTLSIDLNDMSMAGIVNVTIQATAPSLDTIERTIALDIISNDFSALVLTGPDNGATGMTGLPECTWAPSPNAISYEIEIATEPTFGASVVETAANLTETNYTPAIALEENTVHYWRVRAFNRCGAGDFTVPFAFQTVTAACAATNSPNVPVLLPGSVTSRESTISITESGILSDIKVPTLKGTYGGINGLVMTLESPAGTQVVLFSRECGLTNSFDMGFSDGAAMGIGTDCPPTNGLEYVPVEPLSVFNGENTQGTWTLTITVEDPGFGSGGSLDEWSLEFCASLMPSAPYLVNNEAFPIPPGARSQIGNDFLLCQDDDNASTELTYRLVTVPANGTLYRDDLALEVGSTFRQWDIDSWNMSYEHDGGASETDSFVFTVEDGTGGWFGAPTFNIEIFDGAPVGTKVIADSHDVDIYPNPTSSVLNVFFNKNISNDIQLEVYNVQGQQMSTQTFESPQNISVDASELAAGIYFLTIRTTEGVYSKRFVVE